MEIPHPLSKHVHVYVFVCAAVVGFASASFFSTAVSVAIFLEELVYQLACDDSQGDYSIAEQTKSILHSALPHITC